MKTNRLLRIVNKCTVIVFLLIASNCIAQTYPVQTNISSSGPYLNYLSYYGDDNNHLQLTVTQLDFNEPPILARLRIRIEGPGYELYTNPNATVGQPFLLDAGMPLTITGIDLLPYLQQGNLINPSGVDLNNLPHGFTTVCVDVIRESASQQVLSTNNCGFLPIQEYQPPQTFIPTCGDVLDTNTMFHTFTWTPPVPFPAGVGLELFYDFSIYQWADPNNNSALGGTSILVYEATDLIAPTTQVSDFDVIFELGRTYVWKVTARVESNGMPINLIENGGVSAPCTFIYGEAPTLNDVLADGLEIQLFTSPSSERKGKAWWTVTDNTPNAGLSTFDAYFVEYRKQPTGNEGFEIPWFSKTLSSLEYFIYQLEPSTAYEVKVSGVIAGTVGDPTPVETFTTPAARVYNCGESDVPYLPTNYTPLENATAGTQVKIGQFMMTMTEVTAIGAAGHYKGKGEIPIAFLAGAKAKVRFDDILIDTEYLVHEGRVDVITEGLANWLDDQYQQFIDPYFVEGTIDSAYVQDSVAWVVVDGVPQSFNFDPPNYPIIVNDESGNQYTIYPNGTIVVSSYLSISETWAATADEVIHFTQSDSELRGFDPKEHMEWFENYEVMELGDSSKYFVANKSLAKDEADKVNVEIPSGATASFELSDGTAVPSSSLQGSWIGATEHTGSSKMTLDIPARSSSGNYSIYALVNGQKVGQLNVKVYSQKDKELIVVPLVANSGISEIDIENELRKTLGEANIEVDVTLESPWIDSTGTFTASTNISMPSEVGLLSKYSDDMRELRDAYFEQHPSAPKNKYYLFLVNGFDDPNELGYMVRGRSMGFVKVNPNNQSQVLQTISHELGHGMGALEHTFKDDVIAKGSTNNLMDYSADPTNLTKAQWKELRDLDIAPSLFDQAEDGSYGFEEYVRFYKDTKTKITIPSHNKNDAFYLLNGQHYKFQQGGTQGINRIIFDRLGRVFAFETEDFEYYEALITRTTGSEVPLCRSYLTVPEIEEYYDLSNGTGYLSTSQLDYLSTRGYQFVLPSLTDSVYSQSCLFLHNGQTGSAFNLEVFESCLVDRTELITSLPSETIFESPTLSLPPSFTNNNYTVVEGGNCMLPSNINTLDQNGYGADIYYKLREDAPNQTQLIELATYFSQLASNYLYIFYDEETNEYEYIGPSDSDPNVQHRDLTLIPEVFKRENIYTVSAFNAKYPRNTWFYARGRDSIISARNIRSNLVGYYNANTIDYTSHELPNFNDWSANDVSNLEELLNLIEDLYDDVVYANPSYANNQKMKDAKQWIIDTRADKTLALSTKLFLRINVIAVLNTLGAFKRYEYSIVDLQERENFANDPSSSMNIAILSNESNGYGRPIDGGESYTQYVNRFNTESAFFQGYGYLQMAVSNFYEPTVLLQVIQRAKAVRSAYKAHKANYTRYFDDIFKGMKNSTDDIVQTLKNHPQFSKLGLTHAQLDEFKVLLDTKMPNNADDVLTGLKAHLDAGTSFYEMPQMISGLKNNWGNFSDGSKWVFNYTASSEGLVNFGGKKIRFELPTQTELGLRRIDVADITNGETNKILYEFKSVQNPFNSTYATQFAKDLSTASGLNKIRWMYDGSKVNTLNKTQILNSIENTNIPGMTINKYFDDGLIHTKEELIDLIDVEFDNIFRVINL